MLDRLKSSDFSQYLNQTFHIDLEHMGNVELDLIEVKDLGSGAVSDGDESEKRQPFSIMFRGPNDPSLTQGTYEIDHDQFGVFGIFIVPIGPDKEGLLYQAIFA